MKSFIPGFYTLITNTTLMPTMLKIFIHYSPILLIILRGHPFCRSFLWKYFYWIFYPLTILQNDFQLLEINRGPHLWHFKCIKYAGNFLTLKLEVKETYTFKKCLRKFFKWSKNVKTLDDVWRVLESFTWDREEIFSLIWEGERYSIKYSKFDHHSLYISRCLWSDRHQSVYLVKQ